MIALGFGLYVTQTIVKPLAQLETAAHQLGSGDFNIKVDIHSRDELAEVSHAFMTAASKLNEYYGELKFSNESQEQFAYAASHDLQEPIRTITLISDLIRMRYADSLAPEGQRHFKDLADAARRMRELVAGILEYSRLTNSNEPNGERTDTHEIVAVVLESLRAIVTETGAIVTYDTLPIACGSRLRLNCFRTSLATRLNTEAEAPPRVRISAGDDGDMLRFCIADNGIGIEPEYCDQIFGMFKQLNRSSQGGVGMGLAIAKRIVKRHGGSIWVESTLGKGSSFYFTLKNPDRLLDPQTGRPLGNHNFGTRSNSPKLSEN